MIKNLAPLTYNKSFWLRHDDFSYNCYFAVPLVAIEKKEKTARKKKTSVLPSNFYCIYSSDLQPYLNRKLFRVTVSGDQNVKKDGENLRSKLTNHKMTKFPERSEVCLFSLQEALCFYFNVIASFIKKSLTSFVLNKHVHWFIFLHFDPVQIISLLWALYRFVLHSFTRWVNGLKLSLSWLPHCYFE